MNIATSLEQTVLLPIEWNGETANLTVYLERITPETLEEISDAAAKSQVDSLCRIVAQFTKSWDIEWNGEPFPPSFDNLRKLPLKFLAKCAEEVLGLWQGNPMSAKSLPSSSAPQVKEPTA
jgi:hypothetical protein